MNKDTYDILEHYGRKGMKWYQKIYTSEAAVSRKARASARAEAEGLSDQELRTRLNRINMEEQYVNLVGGKPSNKVSVIERGANFTLGFVKKGASKSLSNYVNKELTAQLNKRRKHGDPINVRLPRRQRRNES